MSKVRIKRTALLLAFLFLGYYINQSIFLHMHYVDGVAITHSHPFSHSHSHSHSACQCVALDRFTHFDASTDILFSFLPQLFCITFEYVELIEDNIPSVYTPYLLLRGPPSAFFYRIK